MKIETAHRQQSFNNYQITRRTLQLFSTYSTIAKAQLFLGICYKDGTGVGKNDEQALHWVQEAAKQGEPDAQKVLDLWNKK